MARTSGCQRRSITADQDSDRETEHCRCWIILLVVFLFLLLVFYFVESIIRSGPPDDIKITVTDASLTEFNITSSNNYNLDLNITLRNPNKDFGIYYRYKALVVADYRKTSAMASIANFHQPAKNTTLLTPSFKLQRDNITGDAAASGKGNYYDIVVTLYLPKKYKSVTWWKNDWLSSIQLYACDLKVPLNNGSNSVDAFNTTHCAPNNDYHRWFLV